MFLLFSPYSFLFFTIYLLFLLSLFTINNFYYYWTVMELMMLLFMGISYTIFMSSYSQLMVYFLIQVLSSFFILIFYTYGMPLLLTLSFLMKLSMFPFFMWYINLLYRFPNFMFWLASTLHKIPAMVMIKLFNLSIDLSVLWVSILFTTLISGIMMLSVLDFRMVLVLSSIGNNSWFFMSQMCSYFIFYFFMMVYAISLYFILSNFMGLSKPVSYTSMSFNPYSLSFWVLTLSGMPPFPLFYGKMLVILSIGSIMGFNYFFFMFLLFNSLMVMGYIQSLMKYFIHVYSTNIHYFLNY